MRHRRVETVRVLALADMLFFADMLVFADASKLERSRGSIKVYAAACACRYLAEFYWRFNPRLQLEKMIDCFLHAAMRTQP